MMYDEKKIKLRIQICVVVVLTFMACMWCLDYRSTHEVIELEIPEVSDEIRG
jgi:hypothetical protein